MEAARIVNGLLYSGHYIYVKDRGALTDPEFLESLGLRGYSSDHSPSFPDRYAHIMRCGDWSGFADDWYYTLYNSRGMRKAIDELARRFELLRTAVGDADDSFEFYHYVDGEQTRGYSLNAWGLETPRVVLDAGEPFACEAGFEDVEDPWGRITKIPEEIGIDSVSMTSSLNSYRKERPKQNKSALSNLLPSWVRKLNERYKS